MLKKKMLFVGLSILLVLIMAGTHGGQRSQIRRNPGVAGGCRNCNHI